MQIPICTVNSLEQLQCAQLLPEKVLFTHSLVFRDTLTTSETSVQDTTVCNRLPCRGLEKSSRSKPTDPEAYVSSADRRCETQNTPYK